MEFIILDPNTLTEEQLIEAINSNCKTARITREEIEKLKTIALEESTRKRTIKVSSLQKQEEKVEKEEKKSNRDEDFEDEVNYYLSALNKLTIENLEEEFQSILPSRKNYRYKEILYRLKAEIIRNIKEIKDCIGEEGLNETIAQEFREDLELERAKIKLLTDIINLKEEENAEETTEINNRLIFALTSGGNIRALEELDRIEPEFYDRFNTLFKSIKDGTFKGIKRFASNSEFAGLAEVRGNQVRVVFDRLDKNSYAIITAFVKKTNIDTYYKVAMRKKVSEYYNQHQQIKNNMSNEDFLAQHEFYEQELFNKISQKQQEKPPVKKKGGE